MPTQIRKAIKGLSAYSSGKPIDEVKRELGLTEVIKLASNENPFGSSPKALESISSSLAEINRYPEGSCFYLREALSKKLKIGPQSLIFGNGSDELIEIIAKTFLEQDDEAVISEMAFVRFEMAVKLMGARAVVTKARNFAHDLSQMARSVTEKTKLIFVANPNNPTGTMNTKDEVENFLRDVPEDVLVVFDEAYYEYVDRQDYPKTIDYLKEGRSLIILRTFSKIYGLAGLRIGYGLSQPEIIKDLNRVRPPFNVNSLAQVAALAALGDEQWVNECRRKNEEGREFLYQELDRLGLAYVQSVTNFVLLDVKEDAQEAFKRLLTEGVIVRPITKSYIRVTIGTQEENKKFILALEKVLTTN